MQKITLECEPLKFSCHGSDSLPPDNGGWDNNLVKMKLGSASLVVAFAEHMYTSLFLPTSLMGFGKLCSGFSL